MALVLVLAVELVARPFASADSRFVDQLNEPPPADGIFLLGNSMFHTGIDVPALAELTGEPTVFDYHNGHYTNLWYLISTKALPQVDDPPRVVVWGFRPFYAMDPAFRQNFENDTDLFEPGDAAYQARTIGTDADDRSAVVRWLPELLDDHSELYGSRETAQERLASESVDVGMSVLSTVRPEDTEDFRQRFDAGETSVIDEILRIATDGEVQLAEEQVVDGVGDFVRGPQVDFSGSFIPLIAESIDELGMDQLVVIWRPVAAAKDQEIGDQDRFVEDALAYFAANGIPVADFYGDDRIGVDLFASGDHYNADGRALITEILAEELAATRTSG